MAVIARPVGAAPAALPPSTPGLWTLGRKLTMAISLVIVLGFGAMAYFHARQQERNILQQTESALQQVLDSVSQGLQTVMITASADVAQLYADKLKGVRDIDEIRILRPDGLEAFRDNATIRAVNDYRDTLLFEPRPVESVNRAFATDHPRLLEALRTRRTVHFYDDQHGIQHLTFLLPILNVKRCGRCHGHDAEVLGVLELRSDLTSAREEVRRTWLQSLAVLAVALLAVLAVTAGVLRRYVVGPIERVSQAMVRVASGDLEQRIPVSGTDELSSLAASFNRLTGELRNRHAGFLAEHNKLETILMGTDEGIVVTDSNGAIVLVNAAAEALLGKPAADILRESLYQLFGDPERMNEILERGSIVAANDLFLHRGRHLAVYASTLKLGDGRLLGNAVLIRDMTEEQRLQQRLRELSDTDPLTGLANRRALDAALAREFRLASAQDRDMAVLMFDIDHLKRFNDSHGHDMGDRVLREFALAVHSCVRDNLDIVCRYGGEEFTVIARETSEEGGLVLAERIRICVEAMNVDGLQVTTSIGVAGLRETGTQTPAQLIERADAALYDAKRGGRNRVTGASTGPQP